MVNSLWKRKGGAIWDCSAVMSSGSLLSTPVGLGGLVQVVDNSASLLLGELVNSDPLLQEFLDPMFELDLAHALLLAQREHVLDLLVCGRFCLPVAVSVGVPSAIGRTRAPIIRSRPGRSVAVAAIVLVAG